jgi:hypothetical protein
LFPLHGPGKAPIYILTSVYIYNLTELSLTELSVGVYHTEDLPGTVQYAERNHIPSATVSLADADIGSGASTLLKTMASKNIIPESPQSSSSDSSTESLGQFIERLFRPPAWYRLAEPPSSSSHESSSLTSESSELWYHRQFDRREKKNQRCALFCWLVVNIFR